jgi:hypothetical protein
MILKIDFENNYSEAVIDTNLMKVFLASKGVIFPLSVYEYRECIIPTTSASMLSVAVLTAFNVGTNTDTPVFEVYNPDYNKQIISSSNANLTQYVIFENVSPVTGIPYDNINTEYNIETKLPCIEITSDAKPSTSHVHSKYIVKFHNIDINGNITRNDTVGTDVYLHGIKFNIQLDDMWNKLSKYGVNIYTILAPYIGIQGTNIINYPNDIQLTSESGVYYNKTAMDKVHILGPSSDGRFVGFPFSIIDKRKLNVVLDGWTLNNNRLSLPILVKAGATYKLNLNDRGHNGAYVDTDTVVIQTTGAATLTQDTNSKTSYALATGTVAANTQSAILLTWTRVVSSSVHKQFWTLYTSN